jgi:hypothetical protein
MNDIKSEERVTYLRPLTFTPISMYIYFSCHSCHHVISSGQTLTVRGDTR